MKLLLDQNISRRIVNELQTPFPGTNQVQLLGLEHADDATIWRYARDNGFAIVTKDAGFQEMALLRGPPPKVIWLQCGNATNTAILHLLISRTQAIKDFLDSGEIVCLELS
ncbi:DUF5615 family PIN-like protein [Thioalkalivibrio sulfidiphilus]|uniref:DUF5615 domain-containing protein n=1 Tax=Thioalkalivibrio sulfidiphilus (strain HL-EbGR7) TaxID=396588 RepID=B8GTS7_THISH|nr:DUF5615 family PIN-like protein [Thioalkalivibrio sulfidiphilus]ACL73171.1 conserved hypothetical protein [Thioalkalivibrio sulfidiphilus HL-EbGr7]